MSVPPPRTQPLFWLLALPVVIFICAMVWLIHNLYINAQEREIVLKQANTLEYKLTRIQYLGELLPLYPIVTKTVLSERQHHETWRQELDDMIARLGEGAGLATSLPRQSIDALRMAQAKLRHIERTAFELQGQGKFEDAEQILDNGEYISTRQEFRNIVKHLVESMQQAYQETLATDRRATQSAILSLLVLLLLLTFVWFSLLRRLHTVHQTLVETDIELHEQKQALEVSEARLSAIYNTVIDGIVTIDENGIIESINPAVEEIFGYTTDDLIGQNVKILMPEPDASQHDGYLQRYLQNGEKHVVGISRRVTAKRSDGSTFPADLEVAEMYYGGKHRFSGLIRDLSSYLHK
jgi:PAS domain S-box-containing protein